MKATLSLLLFVINALMLKVDVKAAKNSPCLTPSGIPKTCVPVVQCPNIYSAIQTKNETAIKLAQSLYCGHDDKMPLVCCGPRLTPFQRFNTKELPDETICGIENIKYRIFGGEATGLEEMPWMAALEFRDRLNWQDAGIKCGGSIINHRYVLTAAHCTFSRQYEIYGVRLGEQNVKTNPDCVDEEGVGQYCADPMVKVNVSKVITHPFYHRKTGDNDIALLKLETNITFTDYIRPICLPTDDSPLPASGTPMTVSGWGITEHGQTSDVKLKVELPLVPYKGCIEKFVNYTIGLNQMCAGGEFGKDACQGDSGGPLLRKYHDPIYQRNQWYQEGVVSWGVGCARAGYPAIYTRVSRYMHWIVNNIQ